MTDDLRHLEQELADARDALQACDRADAEGRVANHEQWLNRCWTLRDRVILLEGRLDDLRDTL